MNSGHKALGVLLILFGLILNPILLSLLFSNDGNISTPSVLAVIFSIEITLLLFGVVVLRSGRFVNEGLSIVSTAIVLFLSIGADRFYGAVLMPETASLLFPAFSKAEHNTSEFDLNVQINNLGFRGANTTVQKKKKRVLVIGDSFTFGWGVELKETWVSLLSKKFPSVEFLNVGQGGNHPGDYVRIAKRTIPLLKPDFILVGVLQGNDIHQLMRVIEFEESGKTMPESNPQTESNLAKLNRYLSLVFPNFTKRFQSTTSIQKRWIQDSKKLLSGLTSAQQTKYNSLPQHLRKDFELGLLNPSLVYESLRHPNIFFEAADTSNTLCKKAITRLQDHLVEMDTLAKNYGNDILVLSLPNRPYGFFSETNALAELGFTVDGCDSLNVNLPIQLALSQLEIEAIYPSIKGDSLFYKYDGHWNANGNRIFAEELISELNKLPKWKHFLTSSNF